MYSNSLDLISKEDFQSQHGDGENTETVVYVYYKQFPFLPRGEINTPNYSFKTSNSNEFAKFTFSANTNKSRIEFTVKDFKSVISTHLKSSINEWVKYYETKEGQVISRSQRRIYNEWIQNVCDEKFNIDCPMTGILQNDETFAELNVETTGAEFSLVVI